ncbi:MAG: hypothetical protein EOM19_04385, partial [Candidatus Moranbacteria bacterium]|nr:hypothetical protein [Candidatus Moranbacteria bacterium]
MYYFFTRAIKISFFVGIFLYSFLVVQGQEEEISKEDRGDAFSQEDGSLQEDGDTTILKKQEENILISEEDLLEKGVEKNEDENISKVRINEIRFTGGTGKTEEDFIEFVYVGEGEISLEGWSFRKITGKGKDMSCSSEISSSLYTFSDIHVQSEKWYILGNTKNEYAETIEADFKKTFTIAFGNTILLCDKNKEVRDFVFLDEVFEKFYSVAFFEKENKWIGQYQSTPGKKNEKEEVKEHKKTLRFNELLPRPRGGVKDEFIEIVNFGEASISLAGWKIQDTVGKSIDITGNIESKGFFLDKAKFSLIDKGNTLKLIAPDGEIVDSISYPLAEYGKSYSFDGESWRWVCNETPGKENNFLGFEGIKTIRLEELLPDPDSSYQQEFIELYNWGDEDIDLSGWFITDKTTKKSLSGILPAHTYKAEHFGISLNNSDEKITLLDTCGGEVDVFEYTNSQKGKSWAREENIWKETPFVTKGSKNIFPSKIENVSIRLNEIFPNPSQKGKENEFIEIY